MIESMKPEKALTRLSMIGNQPSSVVTWKTISRELPMLSKLVTPQLGLLNIFPHTKPPGQMSSLSQMTFPGCALPVSKEKQRFLRTPWKMWSPPMANMR